MKSVAIKSNHINFNLAHFYQKYLNVLSKDRKAEVQFVDLYQSLPDDLKEVTDNPHFPRYIGLEQVTQFNGLIWLPTPLDDDWFKTLKEQGYSGKKILLYQPGKTERTEHLISNADLALAYPVGDSLVERIFDYVVKSC